MIDRYPHRAGVHGVTLRANRPIDGLRPAIAGAPEVTIDFSDAGTPASAPHAPVFALGMERLWHLDDSRWLLRYDSPSAPEAWSVHLEPDRMTVCWTPGIPFHDIPTALQGSGLAAMLMLRGSAPLHAAALDVNGGAIVVMGDPGAGKSTTAAAFVRRGSSLLADDTAALEIRDARVLVHPGVPRLRIDEASASALGWPARTLPSVFASEANGRKVFIDAGDPDAAPTPLRAIYVLRPRQAGLAAPIVAPHAPRDALAELLRHTYAVQYLDPRRRARLFESLSQVVARVPVREVRAVDALDALPHLVDTLAAT